VRSGILIKNFPRELQYQFEQYVVANKFESGKIYTAEGLAEQFDVTVDQMLLVLHAAYRKGLVNKQEDGRFEFLKLAPPRDSVFSHTQKLGFNPTSEVREVIIEPASIHAAQKLSVEVGAPVYRFVRTRYVNDEALANQTNFIPFEICPGLENDDVSHYSFQKLLEEKYIAFTAELKETFEIVPANPQDMKILNLPEGSSVLLVQRIAYSATGYPLVWSNIRIRLDRYQYVSKLWPSAAKLLPEAIIEQT
jgi:GntR family transcriptional regulator